MYGICANMTGVFVDGQCYHEFLAYIRIRHGYSYDTNTILIPGSPVDLRTSKKMTSL